MEIKLTMRVIFLLNITKVGENACAFAENLVVVDIPEGIQSIGWCAFHYCISLTTVSFPTTLVATEYLAFNYCKSLDSVDLLHTNLQKLGQGAFSGCSELKSMTIPDSLQTLGENVFWGCDKLVPSSIDLREYDDDGENVPDATPAVIVHLRSQRRIVALEKMLAERDATIVEQAAENEALTTENSALTTENAAQATEIAVLKER
ncbi:hypothetical protein TL16_g06300 [Triparma laevis f. inornata]|uniref:Leucine-rich repeat domain-containing protein n=1 Tax=Triparma laevis f. inornata TaxID=1714386 RepID=A0A9W7APX5_9STRA|nr:hypothetical protein TL16_g06300 [Triparma laevis f. inornata]